MNEDPAIEDLRVLVVIKQNQSIVSEGTRMQIFPLRRELYLQRKEQSNIVSR